MIHFGYEKIPERDKEVGFFLSFWAEGKRHLIRPARFVQDYGVLCNCFGVVPLVWGNLTFLMYELGCQKDGSEMYTKKIQVLC